MVWRKPSPELIRFLDEVLASYQCQRKPMFGSPVYWVNGNMFAGVHQGSLFVRLSEADRQAIFAASDEAAPFEPMPGRPMKEYVTLPESLLPEWVERAHRYALTLPPKVAAPSRPKRGRGSTTSG
jgi:TfoX/Sxy family transcriptional regulator of competence genes